MATSFNLTAMPLIWHDTENWIEQFKFFLSANDISGAKAKATFFAYCGTKAYDYIKTTIKPLLPSDDSVVFNDAMEGQTSITAILETCLKPKVILHYERYKFAMCRQSNTAISDFVVELKRLVDTCDYGTLRNDLLLTQFIIGIDDDQLRMRLLTRADLTFDAAVQEALLVTESSVAASQLQNNNCCSEIDTVKTLTKRIEQEDSQCHLNTPSQCYKCSSCGGRHIRSKCRYLNAKCFNCGRIGHISRVCKKIKSPHISELQLLHNKKDELELNSVTSESNNKLYKCLEVNNSTISFLVDTGSPVSILPADWVFSHGVTVQQCNDRLRSYTGHPLEVLGTAECQVADVSTERTHIGKFYIVQSGKAINILGMD